MSTLLIIVVAVLLFIVFGVIAARRNRTEGSAPRKGTAPTVVYKRRDAMTETEKKFFGRLLAAVPDAVIAPQVAMAALVDVAAHQNTGKYRHVNRSKFAQMRLDFVLFDAQSGEPVCVVELDDHTHDRAVSRAKDAERDGILESVGYPVMRFDARTMPTVASLRVALLS